MTVNNTASSVAFTGNGVTTIFPYTFRIPEDDMSHVAILDIATSVLTELLPSDYVITGIGNDFGGTVTYNPLGVPLPATKRIVIYRELDLIQEMDLTDQSPYYAATLEETLDRIVMMMQQVSDAAARSIKVTLGSTTSPDDLVAQLLAVQAAAAASAAAALTSENNADASELLAMQWATNPEDDDVTPGLYSAFHWAKKAMAYALALAMPAVPAALSYIRRNAANTAYENQTPAEVAATLGALIIPAGFVMFSPSGVVGTGWLACEGAAFSNVTYPALAAYLGGTTLPDYRDRVLRGAGALAGAVLTTQEDAVQNITGTMNGVVTDTPSRTGALTYTNIGSNNLTAGGAARTYGNVGLDLSQGVGAKTATETRVKSAVGKFVIKAH